MILWNVKGYNTKGDLIVDGLYPEKRHALILEQVLKDTGHKDVSITAISVN